MTKENEKTLVFETEEQIEQTEQERLDSERRSGEDRREFSVPYEGQDKRTGEDRRKENQSE